MSDYRMFSFGGGVQSTAVLVMQALKILPEPYDEFVFANVGRDSENPDTIRYMDEVAIPFAQEFNIPFRVVSKKRRDGTEDTLLQAIRRRKSSYVIPVLVEGAGVNNRNCTVEYKLRVLDVYCRSIKAERVVSGIGISTDEWTRVRSVDWHNTDNGMQDGNPLGFWKKREYPLIDMRLSRNDCLRIVREAGLPQPPKSSCWFCPFHRRAEWLEMKNNQPELFEQVAQLEDLLNNKDTAMTREGKRVFIHTDRKPFREAVPDQPFLFIDNEEETATCDVGNCFT